MTEEFTFNNKKLFEAEFGPISYDSYSALNFSNYLKAQYIEITSRKTVCGSCLMRWDCMERKQYQDLGCGNYIRTRGELGD